VEALAEENRLVIALAMLVVRATRRPIPGSGGADGRYIGVVDVIETIRSNPLAPSCQTQSTRAASWPCRRCSGR
jgi:hypothetical protein